MAWEYAELSAAAKAAGGPDKFVKMLETLSRKAGRAEMVPWMLLVGGAGVLIPIAIEKLCEYHKIKERRNQEIDLTREKIIREMREYNGVH